MQYVRMEGLIEISQTRMHLVLWFINLGLLFW